MNENKKRAVASALSLIFAISFLTTNVCAASGNTPPGDTPGGNAMGDPTGDSLDVAPGGHGVPGGSSAL